MAFPPRVGRKNKEGIGTTVQCEYNATDGTHVFANFVVVELILVFDWAELGGNAKYIIYSLSVRS